MKRDKSYYWFWNSLAAAAVLIGSIVPGSVNAASCNDDRFERPQNPGIVRIIRTLDQEMVFWYDEYIKAPSYSWEKDYAYKQLTKKKNELSSTLRSAVDLYGIRTPRLHNIAKEYYQKYLDAPSYSVQKDAYYDVQTKFWGAFKDSAIFRSECRGLHFERLIQMGTRFYNLYLNAPSYSTQKETYYAIHTATFKAAELALDYNFQDEYRDFAQLEALAEDFYQEYIAAPSYSTQKDFYYKVAKKAFDQAKYDLEQALPYMNFANLFAWQKDYSAKYLSAPSYSLGKDYYYQAKVAVQREIESRD